MPMRCTRAGIVPLVGPLVNTQRCVLWIALVFNVAHAQLDAPAPDIHREHPYPHHLPNLYYGERIADEAVGHLRDVYEAVLLDADIHERAEIDDIAYGAL